MNKPTTKRCTICGRIKPLDEFCASTTNKTDGRHSWCKPCKAVRSKTHTARRKAAKRADDKELNELIDHIKKYLKNRPAGTGFMVSAKWCDMVYGMGKLNCAALNGVSGLGRRFSLALEDNPMLLGCGIRQTLVDQYHILYVTIELPTLTETEDKK